MILLHILLGILKVVGILLLILVGLVLLGILLLLFCPVVYEGEAHKDASVYGGYLKISWLFHILSFRLFFGNQEQCNGYSFKIFGISIEKVRKLLQNRKKKKNRKEKKKNAVSVMESSPEETVPCKTEPSEDISLEGKEEYKVQRERLQETEEPEESQESLFLDKISSFFRSVWHFLEKIPGIPGKILGFFRKIGLTVKRICDKIDKIRKVLESERFARLKALFLYHGKRTFLHIRPRKVRGHVKMGTEDPYITGQLLAVAGIFFPLYGEHITIEPYFDTNILEGNLFIKGRIYGGFFAHMAWKLFLDSDIRYMIKKIKQG